MCGIVGLLNGHDVVPSVVESLRRLEYRGYDSAGIAAVTSGGLVRRRAQGRIDRLSAALRSDPIAGTTAIGHTRWATHGRPSEANAHPHMAPRVAVVHNGIVENHAELRRELAARGWAFESETDTEVIPKLIAEGLADGLGPVPATRRALARLKGSFALCALFEGASDLMVAARLGSPLVVGVGPDMGGVASDALALAAWAEEAIDLEDGDLAVVRRGALDLTGFDLAPVRRPGRRVPDLAQAVDLGGHAHFMAKEIFEQPATIAATLDSVVDDNGRIQFPPLPVDLAALDRLVIVACGTSAFAAETARPLFAELAGLPVEIEIASEFGPRAANLRRGEAVLAVSQSGETADTLSAIRAAKARGVPTMGIVNVGHSAIAREVDQALLTHAGPEIGVASTKAFTAQVALLSALAVAAGLARGVLDAARAAALTAEIARAPGLVAAGLPAWDRAAAGLAPALVAAPCVLFMGRGPAAALAREGALKLKETSYIPAEGIAAGELKHGTLALVDERVPVVVIALPDASLPKTLSNLQEVAARGGRVILVGDRVAAAAVGDRLAGWLELPEAGRLTAVLMAAVPLQLLAYHVAVCRGSDVDKPRNLAKSVTVE